jgi:acetyltransferase-like isoleucine patch superfamily enzyme
VELGERAAVGAMSLVTQSLPAWTISLCNPARSTGERSRNLLALEPTVSADG